MIILFGKKPAQSDGNTIQRLHWCNVMYAGAVTSLILPHVELLHKQVKARIDDISVAPP
jgi:hypothetical protein